MLSGYGYYGGYGNYYYDNYESYYDPDKSIKMFGVSVGWGKRLRWRMTTSPCRLNCLTSDSC